jgi:hypothetical protein
MAHEVRAKIDTKVVTGKDLEILVKTSAGKLGTLLISKGNIEWLPKGNFVNKKTRSVCRGRNSRRSLKPRERPKKSSPDPDLLARRCEHALEGRQTESPN